MSIEIRRLVTPRESIRLSLAVAAVGFGQSALIALVPILSERLKLSGAAIGLSAFLGALAFTVAAPLWGRFGARLPLRTLFLWLSALMFAGQALLALPLLVEGLSWAAAFALLALSRLAYGVGSAGVMPHAQAALLQGTPDSARPAALARLSAGLGLGRILGSLAPAGGVAASVVVLVLSPLLLLAAPHLPPRASGVGTGPRIRPGLERGTILLFAVAFALTFALGQIQIVLGLFLQRRFALEPAAAAIQAGLCFAVVAIAMIAVQIAVVPRLGGRSVRNIGLGAGLFAAGSALVAVAPGLWAVMLGTALSGGGLAVATPAYTASLAGRTAPDRQAGMAGWLSSVHVVGQGVGAWAGGVAFAVAPALPFAIGTGLGVATTCLAILALRPHAHTRP